ncbi:MAG: hypothetical protein KF878_04725 [Planctomycetes bacterium]|nr:hypothetical protein [Planctomycetota bacterium]
MDEQARRAEREAAREGGASARVRLAHTQRRAARWADVLATTEGLEQADALAVRAEALLRSEQVDAAAAAGAAARALDPRRSAPIRGAGRGPRRARGRRPPGAPRRARRRGGAGAAGALEPAPPTPTRSSARRPPAWATWPPP